MKISETINQVAVVPEITAKDKSGVIKIMVDALVDAKVVKTSHKGSLIKAVIKRERLGSTGIGRGVAIPHARHDCVKDVVGAFGIVPDGIDFASVDGAKVYAVFLIVSPTTRDKEHLEMMRILARILTDSRSCATLCQVRSREQIITILNHIDNW